MEKIINYFKQNKFIEKLVNKLFSRSQQFFSIKIAIALCAIGIVSYVFLKIKNNKSKLKLIQKQNIGLLRLIKLDLTNKKNGNKHALKLINKCANYPNGIVNYGVNCYINVLLQVKYIIIKCLANYPEFIIFIENFLTQNLIENVNVKDKKIFDELLTSLSIINNTNSIANIYELVNNINNKFSFEH